MENTYQSRNLAASSEYELNQFILKNRKNLDKPLIDFIANLIKLKKFELYKSTRECMTEGSLHELATALTERN